MAGKDRSSPEPMFESESPTMVERLRRRDSAAEEAAALARARGAPAARPAKDEAAVRDQLALARLMLDGGRFSEAEHCFYTLFQVERIHENRWLGGAYDRELKPLLRAMAAIERSHGLDEDEFFAPDDAPGDWRELDRHYEAVLSDKLDEVLAEFGLTDLLDLRRRDPARFERMRETGRLALVAGTGQEGRLLNLIKVYEREAGGAAGAEAYWASIAMIGRAAEARLALHCLRRPDAAREAAARVPDDLRPESDQVLLWTRPQLAAVASAGGWLDNLPDERLVKALVEWLAELPPEEPGRQILAGAQPWLGRTEYQSSLDAYWALRASLGLATRAQTPGSTLQ
jgi:hypothetical protein